ncbi:unnamed protein product [Adineta steineri]|uniref:Sorbitol dehydrogenase n=2 Tax=Adineta steineri TaxID=433720 RepID=A0A814W5G1_9BILA|nr:unnamed protein product [Adineta steineri]
MNKETMKAARYYGAKDLRVEETPIPSANKKQIKIEVKYSGICGSDLHEYCAGPIVIPINKPYPLTGHCGCTTMGHEFSGVVVQVGDDLNPDNIKIGDRVVVEPMFRNPDSFFTKRGEFNLSEPGGGLGVTANGGFAKYVVAEDYMVHKIPDSMTFEQGALVEPAAVAVYAVKNSGLQLGETCVIFGAGPIGLLCLLAAKAVGAARTIVVDIAEKRLEKARELGATLVINGKEENIAQKIKSYTDGLGVNVYFDAAGVQSTFTTGIASLRKGGKAVLIAVFEKPVTLNATELVFRQITIQGTLGYRHIFPEVIRLIESKQMDVERIITKKIKLDDIVKDGFEALLSNPSEIKILIDIDAN